MRKRSRESVTGAVSHATARERSPRLVCGDNDAATTALKLGLATAVAVLAGIWIYASDTE